MTTPGARSPPMASTAMMIGGGPGSGVGFCGLGTGTIPRRRREPVCRDSTRNSDTRDAAACAHDIADTRPSRSPSRCRACGAWKCVSSNVVVWDSASSIPLLSVRLQRFQRFKSRVHPRGLACARFAVAIRAAHGTETLARFLAERLHRQRQVELLSYDFAEVDRLVLVVRHSEVVLFDGTFFFRGLSRHFGQRQEQEIQLGVHRDAVRLQTPTTVALERRGDATGQSCLVAVLVDLAHELHRRRDAELLIPRGDFRRWKLALDVLGARAYPA